MVTVPAGSTGFGVVGAVSSVELTPLVPTVVVVVVGDLVLLSSEPFFF